MTDKSLESYLISGIATEGLFGKKEKHYTPEEEKYASMDNNALAKEMVQNLRDNNVVLARADDPAVTKDLEDIKKTSKGPFQQVTISGYPVVFNDQKILFKPTTVFTVWFDGCYFNKRNGKTLGSLPISFTREELIKHLPRNTLAADSGIQAKANESYIIYESYR